MDPCAYSDSGSHLLHTPAVVDFAKMYTHSAYVDPDPIPSLAIPYGGDMAAEAQNSAAVETASSISKGSGWIHASVAMNKANSSQSTPKQRHLNGQAPLVMLGCWATLSDAGRCWIFGDQRWGSDTGQCWPTLAFFPSFTELNPYLGLMSYHFPQISHVALIL
eukprot:EG_transcript_38960